MSKTRLKGDKAITRFDDEKDKQLFVEIMVRARDSPPYPKLVIKDEDGYEMKGHPKQKDMPRETEVPVSQKVE